jgi:hypothetical protein
MVRHLDWSPGPLPGLRFEKTSSNRVLVLSERRARSEPAPLAEEGEARAALDPPALGDRRDKLSTPGAAQ